jgi:hypothetical protein
VTRVSDDFPIAETAEYLVVSPSIRRNWERVGKIVAHRHPVTD